MTDWFEKRVDTLIKAAETSIQRTRDVFMVVTIIGVMLLVANFNGNIPLIRNSIYQLELQQKKLSENNDHKTNITDNKNHAYDEILQSNRKTRREIWEKELGILAIPVFGLKVHYWDANLIGAAAMSILSLWYYFAARRENHVVDEILKILNDKKDLREEDPSISEWFSYVFSSISHQFVFITLTTQDSINGSKVNIPKYYTTALVFMPFWVPLSACILDITTMFMPMEYLRWEPFHESVWDKFDSYMSTEICIREFITLMLVTYNFKTCTNIKRLQDNTKSNMLKMEQLKNS